ncbi:myb-like protein I [Procambarus clarkii]|uniref:myb-like protein I n=1 Tax=Procambarus clarkii TaxID=6728 RepID=UPI0037449A3B
MGVGGEVSEGGPHSPLRKDGSYWQQVFSPSTSHSTNNMDGDAYNPASDSHNYNTSLLDQGSFFSIVNQNGNMHKLLKDNIGTGVMDRVMNYFFEKMGTRRSRSFGLTYLADQNNHQPHTDWHHNTGEIYKADYGSNFGSYSYENEYVKSPNSGLCIDTSNHYLRSDGPLCLDVYTVVSIAAVGVLLQVLLHFTVAAICPISSTRSLVFNITNDNFINVGSKGGNQSQNQDQNQVEYQDQNQFEYQNQDQEEYQDEMEYQSESQDQFQNQDQTNTQDVTATDNGRRLRQNTITNTGKELNNQKIVDLNNDGGEVWPKNSSLTKSSDISQRLGSLDQSKFNNIKGELRSASHKSEILTRIQEWSKLPIWQEMARKMKESDSEPWNLRLLTLGNWPNFDFGLGDWANFNILGDWNDESSTSVTFPKDYICSVINTFLKG